MFKRKGNKKGYKRKRRVLGCIVLAGILTFSRLKKTKNNSIPLLNTKLANTKLITTKSISNQQLNSFEDFYNPSKIFVFQKQISDSSSEVYVGVKARPGHSNDLYTKTNPSYILKIKGGQLGDIPKEELEKINKLIRSVKA